MATLSIEGTARQTSATVSVDGKQIYTCADLKAGMFDLPYEYPTVTVEGAVAGGPA